VEVRLRQGPSGHLLEQVGEGQLDFAFLSHSGAPPRGTHLTPIGEDPLVLACAVTHPIAQRTSVTLAECAREPFLEGPPQGSVRMVTDRAFAAARLEREIAYELNDGPTLLELVANRLGVAILPRFVAIEAPGIRCIPLDPALPAWRLFLARRERHPLGPAARALLGLILPRAPGEETGGRRGLTTHKA
jgi:DNA-binding transcriptional LysR family regulator